MTLVMRIVACSALSAFAAVPASYAVAASSGNPYEAIVSRNVFALKPMPPPVPAGGPEANKPPLPPIALTGITTILNQKRAFLSIQMPPVKGEPAKPPQTFMLAEGQRDSDIEVIEIDDKGGSVKVNAFGTITNVPFAQMAKTAAPPPGAPAPGAPPAPTGIPAPPPNPFSPNSGGFNRNIPTRTLRLPGTGDGQNASQPGASGGSVLPGSGMAAGGMSAGEIPNRTPEETVALYEANRLKNEALRAQGVNIPRLPQHPYLKGIDNGGGEGAPQQQQAPGLPLGPGFRGLPAPQ